MNDGKRYEPGMGQWMFGQPWGECELPEIWEAALTALDSELQRVMWNRNQEKYQSPFSNTGVRFEELPEFQVRAYNWDEGAPEGETWNFRWRDVEVRWYKHLWRGSSVNRLVSPDEAAAMLAECLPAIRKLDYDPVEELSNGQDTTGR